MDLLHPQSKSIFFKILLAFGIGLIVWLGLFFFTPSLRPHLDEEDMFSENATIVLLGLSFLLGLFLAVLRKDKIERLTALGIGLFAGVALGDELSWGERVFSITMPYMAGKKFDGIHDLVEIIWDLEIAGSNDVWRVVMLTVVLGLMWRFRKFIRHFILSVMSSPAGVALVAVAIFGGLALILDIHIVKFAARHAVEEYCELAAAVTILYSLILLAQKGMKPGDDTTPEGDQNA